MTFHNLVEAVRAVTGWDTSLYEIMLAVERSMVMSRIFNLREGFGPDDDKVIRRWHEPMPGGPIKGKKLVEQEFQRAIEVSLRLSGWDQTRPADIRKIGRTEPRMAAPRNTAMTMRVQVSLYSTLRIDRFSEAEVQLPENATTNRFTGKAGPAFAGHRYRHGERPQRHISTEAAARRQNNAHSADRWRLIGSSEAALPPATRQRPPRLWKLYRNMLSERRAASRSDDGKSAFQRRASTGVIRRCPGFRNLKLNQRVRRDE